MIETVAMYRVVCDAGGCGESAQDASDYAWAQQDVALDEAADSCWYVGEFGQFCQEHMPRCPCGVRVDDDDVDGLCVDCESEVGAPQEATR